MAVLGAAYTIDPNYRTPEEVLASLFRSSDDSSPYANNKPRPKPITMYVRASMQRDAADTLQPAREERFDWLEQEYNERNPNGSNKNILLMDGEAKLWEMGGNLCLNGQCMEILDIIHACSYIWACIQALYPKNSIFENIPLVKEQVARLLNGRADMVIRSFRWNATHKKLTGDPLKDITTAWKYLEKNINRMKYNEYLKSGYPIASGVIEGACRNVVVDRMECSGMC